MEEQSLLWNIFFSSAMKRVKCYNCNKSLIWYTCTKQFIIKHFGDRGQLEVQNDLGGGARLSGRLIVPFNLNEEYPDELWGPKSGGHYLLSGRDSPFMDR